MNGMAYKTSLLKEMNFRLLEGINYTDTLYCFLPYSRVKDFIVYDLYLYHYRMGREGAVGGYGEPEKESDADCPHGWRLCLKRWTRKTWASM